MEKNTLWATKKFDCPHCKAVSAFSCVFSGRSIYGNNYYPISVWACHNCDRCLFVRNEATTYSHVAEGQLRIEDIYPSNEPSVDVNVPTGIAEDFVEATKCYNISAYKAAVTMCRRTIQKTCLDLGADTTKRLVDQIKGLQSSGKLHPDLAALATEVRMLGNDGAHPSKDDLDSIEHDDVKEILEFTEELLDDLYIRPHKVAAVRAKRQAKKAKVTATQ